MFSRNILGITAASLAVSFGDFAPLRETHHRGETRYPAGHKTSRSIYQPHQGEREMARRRRQAERDTQRQTERGDSPLYYGLQQRRFSRRGLPIEAAQ